MSSDHAVLWPGWEVVGRIGAGSFGTVFEIQRDVFGRIEKSALKVISIPEKPDEIEELYSEGYDQQSITSHFRNYLEDLVREYSLMLDMKGHTNVVYCDDLRYVQHEDGIGWTIYIKMELLTPLLKTLDKHYSEEQTIRVGIDICNALQLCKNMSIVHRDIKPQNIFMSKTGNYKLGDFGVAKVSDKTASGTKIGTYEYMAPEVFLGQPYGAGADMYSLGLVLYWMMNEKRTPFLPMPPQIPSASAKESARSRRFHNEPLPRPVNGSQGLWQIVRKACAFSPADRYSSAEEMRAALSALLTAAPIGVATAPKVSPLAEDADERTVSVFHDAIPKQEPAPAAEDEDDLTISMFHSVPPKQKPAPEEPAPKEPAPAKASADPQPDTTEPTPPVPPEKTGKKKFFIFAAAAIAVLAAVIIGCFMPNMWPASNCETAGHQWIAATCTSPKTCAQCGETSGSVLEHTWTPATCTTPKTCSRCGTTSGSVLGHTWTPATCIKPTTCVRCSTTAGSADPTQHHWIYDYAVSFYTISVKFTSTSDSDKAAAKEQIDRILDSFLYGDATQASFAELGKQCDRGTLDAQYLSYENAACGQLPSAIRSWCYQAERNPGDVAIVEEDDGYYLVYFVSKSDVAWRCERCGVL